MAIESVCPKQPGPERDQFLKELMGDLDRHFEQVKQQWAGRPIASEQDLVEWYRLANPEVGDEFARMVWRNWPRAMA